MSKFIYRYTTNNTNTEASGCYPFLIVNWYVWSFCMCIRINVHSYTVMAIVNIVDHSRNKLHGTSFIMIHGLLARGLFPPSPYHEMACQTILGWSSPMSEPQYSSLINAKPSPDLKIKHLLSPLRHSYMFCPSQKWFHLQVDFISTQTRVYSYLFSV